MQVIIIPREKISKNQGFANKKEKIRVGKQSMSMFKKRFIENFR